MSRAIHRVDRVLLVLLGLVLLAGGLLTLFWGTRPLEWPAWHSYLSRWPQTLDVSGFAPVTAQPWWPWALLAGSVAVVLLGAWLMLGHVPRRHVGHLLISGTGLGTHQAVASPIADAAAVALNLRDGIETAYGAVHDEDGVIVMKIDAVIEPDVPLEEVATACQDVAVQLRHVVGREDVRLRIVLRVGRRAAERVS